MYEIVVVGAVAMVVLAALLCAAYWLGKAHGLREGRLSRIGIDDGKRGERDSGQTTILTCEKG